MARWNREENQKFEDLSSYSSSKEYKKRKKNRRGRTVLRGFAVALCLLFILFGSGLVYVSTDLLDGLTTTSIPKDNETLGIDPENIVMDDSIKNIALFGVDSRNDDFTGLSDVIMILTVDNKHGKLKMTSILRDSQVLIDGESYSMGYISWEEKINAAYSYGGPELAIRTLNQNFGLDIRDYVTVNFANMAAIVDAFGGVDIVLTAEEVSALNNNLHTLALEIEDQKEQDQANGTYEDHTYAEITDSDYIPDLYGNIDFSSGAYEEREYHLNGDQAVAYGHIRKIDSDYERVRRQQNVFTALIGKLGDMGLTDYTTLISEMMPYCETSLEVSDVLAMTPILFSGFTMESISVPDANFETDLFDGNINNIYYMIYDTTAAAERISSFIYEEDSPYWEQYGDSSLSSVSEG